MNNIISLLIKPDFITLIWLFFFGFVIHELEEWNIDQYEQRHFIGLPSGSTDRSARMWIACVCLIGLVWTVLASLPADSSIAAWIFLPAVAILVQNALQHIYWSFYFKQYSPGTTTAIVLIAIGSYMFYVSAQKSYLPGWYLILLGIFIIAGLIQTLRAGKQMTPLIQAINRIGIILSDRIR